MLACHLAGKSSRRAFPTILQVAGFEEVRIHGKLSFLMEKVHKGNSDRLVGGD